MTPDSRWLSPASLSCVWCSGKAHTPVPSLQMHMWVRLSVIPLRAAAGADLGGAYFICSMTSVTRRGLAAWLWLAWRVYRCSSQDVGLVSQSAEMSFAGLVSTSI